MNLRDGSIDHEKATNPKMMTMRVRAFLYKRNNIILCEKKKKKNQIGLFELTDRADRWQFQHAIIKRCVKIPFEITKI